jgi:3-hydroxyacyl-CoA dehydrogenase/enoyl-CoA hydratase/3-hydroxybutyryl-CoA epimerase
MFHYDKDADGIVTISMDMEGSFNSMNKSFTPLYRESIDRLTQESDLTGVVITSSKDTFFVGGDLRWLVSVTPDQEDELVAFTAGIKAEMRRLETLGVPVVAAINGAAAGGGLEVALACHHRIALNAPKVRIGLPEVTLGLLPGAGGTVRVSWMLGFEQALKVAQEGKLHAAKAAQKLGLIDDTVETEEALLPAAKAWITQASGNADAHTQPWDNADYTIPGGASNSPEMEPVVAKAKETLLKRSRGLLPAPEMIIDIAAQATGGLSFDDAQTLETASFAKLTPTPVAKNMISTNFFAMNKIRSGAARPKGIEKTATRKVGVLGAGIMGQGITYCSAVAGIEVVLKDVTVEGAERAKAYSANILQKRVDRGQMSEETRLEVLDRIKTTDQTSDLAGCDMIIEAVFERLDVKKQVLAEHEDLVIENGIWGSNTSSLPITRLAETSKAPEKFIGLHFFSPVDKMQLLEIVVGKETSEETLARALDFAQQIGKVPVVVNDGTGFYTSRVINTMMDEGAQMVAEGVAPARIEKLSQDLGYPMGPLTLFDEVQLSLCVDMFETQVSMGLRDAASDPTPEARELLRSMVKIHNRKSRVGGGGFYSYADGNKTFWEGLAEWRNDSVQISDQDIKDRVLFRAVIETLRCLEEGILRSGPDGDVASILGIGAPAWTGGYVQFVKTYGVERFQSRCNELAQAYGARFDAPPMPAS